MRPTRPRTPFDPAEYRRSSEKDRQHHALEAKHYDQAITKTYEIYHAFDLAPWIRRASQGFPSGRALDLGTGTGVVALPLAQAGFSVVAIDHSREMLAVAQSKSTAEAPILLVQSDVLHTPFASNTFDVISLQGVLHHVPTAIEGVVTEAARVLKPGGLFYCSEPCADASLLGRVLRLGAKKYDPEGEDTDEEAIAWDRFRLALEATGLEFQVRFVTHIPSAHFHYWLSPRLRIFITRVLSAPFRRGDLLFVEGRKSF